jgi:hypothetical protein
MTEQSSPLYLVELVRKINMKEEYRSDDDVIKLLLVLELQLPKPFVHGKKCSNCKHRMHCKSVRCPMCHTEMRKRKREPGGQKKDDGGEEDEEKKKREEERKKEREKECAGECAQDLTGREYDTLPCGHIFCHRCMGNRVRRKYVTCCNCDHTYIPNDIIVKYGGEIYIRNRK